ncbi:MAG TPA: HesA/MoeB/ThiF family protein [Bacteroidia bacterium]|nr:HesA/MoeB/ThiF family protein [Bacteroidia bacterium]
MLSKEEIKRYSKQLLLPEIGIKGQERLKNSRVLVIGAGGLGCPVLKYLAAAGVGTLGILDFDSVDETNLQRQVLYNTDDVGKSKALVAAEKISRINPHIKVESRNMKLESSNAFEIISDYDLIVDCSDNFPTRYLINDTCVFLNKLFVYGGIHKFEGQLSVFNFKTTDENYGPTYRCAFPETHPEETLLNCSATGVIGIVPGIIGTLQANEVIKIITGIGEVCSEKMLVFNALNNTFIEIKIKRDESAWDDIPKTVTELQQKIYFSSCEEIAI